MSEEIRITGVKEITPKWVANSKNFVWDFGSMNGTRIYALQFNNGILLGYVDCPRCLVVGRCVEALGMDCLLLDTEDGNYPARITAVYAVEGEYDRMYGKMTLMDFSKQESAWENACVSVGVSNNSLRTMAAIFEQTKRVSDMLNNDQDVNGQLYNSMLNTPAQAHVEMIQRFYQDFNNAPFNETFRFLDTYEPEE